MYNKKNVQNVELKMYENVKNVIKLHFVMNVDVIILLIFVNQKNIKIRYF